MAIRVLCLYTKQPKMTPNPHICINAHQCKCCTNHARQSSDNFESNYKSNLINSKNDLQTGKGKIWWQATHWPWANKGLQFKFKENALPNSATTEQLLLLCKSNKDPSKETLKSLQIFMANRGIKIVNDLYSRTNAWREQEEVVTRIRNVRGAGTDEFQTQHRVICNTSKPTDKELSKSSGCCWSREQKLRTRWCHPNQILVKRITIPRRKYMKLNRRWELTRDNAT